MEGEEPEVVHAPQGILDNAIQEDHSQKWERCGWLSRTASNLVALVKTTMTRRLKRREGIKTRKIPIILRRQKKRFRAAHWES